MDHRVVAAAIAPYLAAMTCVACGGRTVRQTLLFDRAQLARCVRCGHALTVRVRTRRTHLAYGVAADARARYETAYLPARMRSYRRGLTELAPPGRLLDVGANYGHFLAAAAKDGWEAHGVEASPLARTAALADVTGRMHAELQDAAPYAPFDAITLWDVLEHVADPRTFLRDLVQLLSPDGVLLVRVPDARALTVFAGLRAQAYLTLCHPTNPEEHPHHYTPASLAAIADGCRLQIAKLLDAADDERVVAYWNGIDRRARQAMHRMAAGVPYELTAILRRSP